MSIEVGRRERRKQATRNAILEVAITLMETHGIDGVTMEEIAARADVAKATLYAYFPSKEALIAGWLRLENSRNDSGVAEILAAVPSTRQRLHVLFRHTSAWQIEHRALLERYVPYRLTDVLRPGQRQDERQDGSGFGAHLATILVAGREMGDVRSDLPLPELIRALEGAYLYVLLGWLACPDQTDLVTACVGMVDLFLDGAAAVGERS